MKHNYEMPKRGDVCANCPLATVCTTDAERQNPKLTAFICVQMQRMRGLLNAKNTAQTNGDLCEWLEAMAKTAEEVREEIDTLSYANEIEEGEAVRELRFWFVDYLLYRQPQIYAKMFYDHRHARRTCEFVLPRR